MRKTILAILAAILASLACTQAVVPFTPTASPSRTPTPTASPAPTARATAATDATTAIVRQFSVNIHAEPDVNSEVKGYVYADDVVTVLECQDGGEWCKIEQPFGWIYRGCLAGFEEGLGCEAVR